MISTAASEMESSKGKLQIWPLLFVKNIDHSIAFYEDRLGFVLDRKADFDGKIFWCRLSRQGCSIMLQQAEAEDGPLNPNGVVFYFICEDADRIYQEFTERGLSLQPPTTSYGMRQVNVPEPDGYKLCFENEV